MVNPEVEDYWFDTRQDAVRYMLAQLTLAACLAGAVTLGAWALSASVVRPLHTAAVVGLLIPAIISTRVIGRLDPLPSRKWWESRDAHREARVIAVMGSRMLFKHAADVAGWGHGWVLARDSCWAAVVAAIAVGIFISLGGD